MKEKLKAILIGGPNNGKTQELDEVKPEIKIACRMQGHNGQMRVTGIAKYKLKSNGPPLQYEFVGSN